MPGRGRRGGPGFGRNWWLEAYILLSLYKGSAHGYELLDKLARYGITWPGKGSVGIVYKQLRDMEARGLVSSAWDTIGKGPPRRIYTITPLGVEYLRDIVNNLKAHLVTISNFITEFEERRR